MTQSPFINCFQLLQTTINTAREKNINFSIYFIFFITFNTIKIHFILCEIFIYSFLSSWSISTLFTGINSSWLKSESIREIENKTSMVFNLVSARNTILSCFFFFFLNYWLMLLVSLWKFLVFASNSISSCFFFFFLNIDLGVLVPAVITEILLLL